MSSTKRKKERGKAKMRDVTEQLMELRTMTVGDLRHRYEELFGAPTRTRNKDWLVKKLSWRIQELAEGGLSKRAEAKIAELEADAPVRHNRRPGEGEHDDADRDPRLPPVGTILTRKYKGKEYAVTILADGFEYDGETFGSLSAVALAITGTVWNGLLFFGLKKRSKKGNAS